MTSTVLVFIVGAIAINLVTYGGITWMYFAGKHRVDPPRQYAPIALSTRPAADAEDHEPRVAA